MTITPQQVKNGRQMLGWSLADLAGHSGISRTTMGRFENGEKQPSALEWIMVRRALEAAGVEFPEHGAAEVRLRAS